MAQSGDVIENKDLTIYQSLEILSNSWQWGVIESKNVKNGTLTVRTGKKQLTKVSKHGLWELRKSCIFFVCIFLFFL